MSERVTYKTCNFEIHALSAAQLARMEEIKLHAEAAYLAGETVLNVYVSDLDLAEPEFKVGRADFAEIKVMTFGHLQIADECRLPVDSLRCD